MFSGGNHSAVMMSAMTMAALAQDSSAMLTMNDSADPTWDILSMANEATNLWTYGETVVVGNSGLAVSLVKCTELNFS